MSPSSGFAKILVARNLKVLRLAAKNATKTLQSFQNAVFGRQAPQLQPIYARVAPRQPVHPAALARQSKRWFSASARTPTSFTSTVRRFTSSAGSKSGVRYDRSTFPTSRVASAITKSTGRAPFSSTLRPNLTGGALGRTAGGYGMGSGRVGGARYFSHGPATTGQVINNVSQAVRAFFIGGQKVQYDGVNPRTGGKRYKAVGPVQDQASKKMSSVMQTSPGAFIDFSVNPTITALTPLASIPGFVAPAQSKFETLHTEGLLDVLSVDFSRSLKELAIIMNDLKKLSELGDLPITYENSCLRVHFPGCDAETVERLAMELDLQRGVVGLDAGFDAFVGTDMALLFPFAPSKPVSECSLYDDQIHLYEPVPWHLELSPPEQTLTHHTSDYSTRSVQEYENVDSNPWVSSPSGYDSLHSSDISDYGARFADAPEVAGPLEYSGIEGIYRFIEQCDTATSRRRQRTNVA